VRLASLGALGTTAVLAWACSGGPEATLPPPTILGVEPARLPVNAHDEAITVRFDARYAMTVDYGAKKVDARMGPGRLWVDEQEAAVESFDPLGVAVVKVPRGLGTGEHRVKLRLDDGREAEASGALVLYPPGQGNEELPDEDDAGVLIALDAGPIVIPEQDAGTNPTDAGTEQDAGPHPDDPMREGDVTGFTFDAIEGSRTNRQAFAITVRAQGPRAPHFEGSVELMASRGTVSPTKIGPCDDGVCHAIIVMEAPTGDVRIIAMDSFGVTGTSNTFRLEPGP
jgi:hypothetical protein